MYLFKIDICNNNNNNNNNIIIKPNNNNIIKPNNNNNACVRRHWHYYEEPLMVVISPGSNVFLIWHWLSVFFHKLCHITPLFDTINIFPGNS